MTARAATWFFAEGFGFDFFCASLLPCACFLLLLDAEAFLREAAFAVFLPLGWLTATEWATTDLFADDEEAAGFAALTLAGFGFTRLDLA